MMRKTCPEQGEGSKFENRKSWHRSFVRALTRSGLRAESEFSAPCHSVLSAVSLLALLVAAPGAAQVRLQGNVKFNGNVTLRIPPLSLTSLSPTSGPAGTTAVTIIGTSLGGIQGSSTIDFGGTAPTVTSWINTNISVVVPAALAVGTVLVQVTVAGVNSNPIAFTVTTGVPTGNQISLLPASGQVGTPVTITGINFGATQGLSTVAFNGTAAAPSSWSMTSIVAPVPSGATSGLATVTVNNVPYTASFTVAPLITGISPPSGTAGTTSVTISGSNFGATQGTSSVTFGGAVVDAQHMTSWSLTSIVVIVPSGATNGPVVVTVGGYASNPVTFTVTATNPPPCS